MSNTGPHKPGVTQWLGIIFLIVGALSASLVFRCATPFAAFAVFSAAILPWRVVLMTMAGMWLINQALGFGLLGYPATLDAVFWGVAVGTAAQLAALIAITVLRRLARAGQFTSYAVALVASFAVYELCLLAIAAAVGETENEAFAGNVIGWLALLNAIWLAALAALYEAARLLEPVMRRRVARAAST